MTGAETADARTLLLVEDDVGIRSMLATLLGDHGFETVAVADAESALYEFSRHAFDAVLVDLGLPGLGGLDLCAEIRRQSLVPIVVVTARTSRADVLAALEAGADDHVSKPVHSEELVKRVRHLVERADPATGDEAVVDAGTLRVGFPSGHVTVNGDAVTLPPVQERLIAALAERPGTVVRREVLMERALHAGRIEDLDWVDVHMRRLCAALAERADRVAIEPVLGVGWRLRA